MPPIKKRQNPHLQMRQTIERWKSLLASFFVLAVFIVQPLIISPRTYHNITETKLYCYAAIVFIVLATFLVITILAAAMIPGYWKGKPREVLRAIRPYEYALAAYWLVMVISTLLADSPMKALLGSTNRNEGLLMMTAYLLSVVMIGRLYRPRERDLLILCAVAALVSAYGILQYYGIDPLHFSPASLGDVQGPALMYVSTMSNRNVLSTYLCLVYGVCAMLFTRGQGPRRWAYFGIGLIVFYMMILGQTEGGYVGVFVALALLLPFLVRGSRELAALLLFGGACILSIWFSVQVHFKSWQASFWAPIDSQLLVTAVVFGICAILFWLRSRQKEMRTLSTGKKCLLWYGLALLLAVGIVLLIPRIAAATDHKTVHAANEILQGNIDDSLGSNRMYIWKRLLTMVPERPVFGHGPDHFFINFTERFGEEAKSLHYVLYDKAHNEYLQVAFDNGLLGLAALLGFYVLMLRRGLRQMDRGMVAALVLALSIFLVQAIFNFSSPFAHPVAWALWGFLGAVLYPKAEQQPV